MGDARGNPVLPHRAPRRVRDRPVGARVVRGPRRGRSPRPARGGLRRDGAPRAPRRRVRAHRPRPAGKGPPALRARSADGEHRRPGPARGLGPRQPGRGRAGGAPGGPLHRHRTRGLSPSRAPAPEGGPQAGMEPPCRGAPSLPDPGRALLLSRRAARSEKSRLRRAHRPGPQRVCRRAPGTLERNRRPSRRVAGPVRPGMQGPRPAPGGPQAPPCTGATARRPARTRLARWTRFRHPAPCAARSRGMGDSG